MPRKAFIADVKTATEQDIPGITYVGRGDDDGEVKASYTPVSGTPIELSLVVAPDVGSYPMESSFMIIINSDDIPDVFQSILQSLADTSAGMTIPQLLGTISTSLRQAAAGTSDNPYLIASDDEMATAETDSGADQSDLEDEYLSDFGIGGEEEGLSQATYKLNPDQAATINHRIREDLRAVRFAGFKIGILAGMKADCVHNLLSVSIQVKTLGLSDEATQAWDLVPDQYIVLLIRYSSGYKDVNSIIVGPAKSNEVTFRIGVCNRYKPTVEEALAAFTDNSTKNAKKAEDDTPPEEDRKAGFTNMFISSSLNEFTNSQFVSLLKIRHAIGVGWDGAKRYFNDKQGKLDSKDEVLPAEYQKESKTTQTALPSIVMADHITDQHVHQHSFPLIAAQFCLRYFTQCTEFCLVCHDRIQEEFGALKPYVCEKPLCLYQYMSLGFGPSVEHEILTQPYVVDLLISFCYASAMSRRLREYPVGMSLLVPHIPPAMRVTNSHSGNVRGVVQSSTAAAPTKPISEEEQINCKYDSVRCEIIFEEKSKLPVRNGEWVAVSTVSDVLHHRVEDVSFFPTVKLSDNPITRNSAMLGDLVIQRRPAGPATPSTTPPPALALTDAKVSIYNLNFDDIDEVGKSESIVVALDTLPSVQEMKAYLQQQSRVSEPSLRGWKERVSPVALGILRWIIASNRSCIVQVDKCPGQAEEDILKSRVPLGQRLTNMTTNWVQFRFAQGSPDKEQRFLNALKVQQSKLKPKYPTIFAFHGSPLQNWHSIIRSGLDFKETLHGRAYGHGVYHAIEQSTSVGYAQNHGNIWQGSGLKISSAMSLNEIVNCPDEYTSHTPYLVVQHIDWIQCRYLLVQVQGNGESYGRIGTTADVNAESDPSMEVEQDPARVALSTLRKPIGVPLCATSISKAFRVDLVHDIPRSKKIKRSSEVTFQANDNPSAISDVEDADDLAFLFTDDEGSNNLTKAKGKEKVSGDIVMRDAESSQPSNLTDFKPSSLDHSSLPMLVEPAYATPIATKTLARSLQEILNIQRTMPLHELGWYIDEALVSNVYQWIVELHSFDGDLPLAQDMKSAGFTSIVLEIRFGKDFPFSPPFVRVIRPRFLPFTQGGGGHVTGGGAMCMELLTNNGWSSVSSMDSVLLQVRLAMTNLEPRPARLEGQGRKQKNVDYTPGEAMAAFIRACTMHGWEVPKDFKDFAGASESAT